MRLFLVTATNSSGTPSARHYAAESFDDAHQAVQEYLQTFNKENTDNPCTIKSILDCGPVFLVLRKFIPVSSQSEQRITPQEAEAVLSQEMGDLIRRVKAMSAGLERKQADNKSEQEK